jgi:uric acid-xanthine permease
MYDNGFCPTDSDGNKLPCPEGYGAILGTAAVCALLEILISFLPPKVMLKIFPPIVTGPTVMLIGISLIESGFSNWAGGNGPCIERPVNGIFAACPTIYAPHALPWGSAEYVKPMVKPFHCLRHLLTFYPSVCRFIGLGFLVFITIILCERFAPPIMKTTSVICGLLTGCIVAAACGYFDRTSIDAVCLTIPEYSENIS